jgi:hypothetical protein
MLCTKTISARSGITDLLSHHHLNSNTTATMARAKPTATNANAMFRKQNAAPPKATNIRHPNGQTPVKNSDKKGTQQQSIPPNSVAAGRVKKGQAKTITKANGRVPKKSSRVHPDNWDFDPNQEYRIIGIMAERKKEFKIKWAGKDSAGNDFVNTWVPRSFANKLAKLDWALRTEQNKRNVFNDSDGEEEEGRGNQKQKKAKTAKKSTKAGVRRRERSEVD